MENKSEIFNNEDYKFISDFVEEKLPILRSNENFNNKYLKLLDLMDSLDMELSESQKKQLGEIVDLFYQTEEYYFAFAYSLGVKYGEFLNKL